MMAALDVCLVQMPYAAVQHPSIALGLLKAYLNEAGLSSRVIHGNIRWAEELGLDVYILVQETLVMDLLGEWTFAGAAFPGFEPDHARFLAVGNRSMRGIVRALDMIHPGADAVRLLDAVRERAGAFIDRLADEVLATSPRIVGASSVFQQHCASLALLRRIKALAPDVTTMIGGANCEERMGPANHRAFPWLDFVVSGEADGFFADLCGRILAEGPEIPVEELPEGVYGPRHREAGAESRVVARPVVNNLDQTTTPDYDDYFVALGSSSIARYVQPGLLVETSRGCWWGQKRHCTFCGLNGVGMSFRSKSPERVLDEFRRLSQRYGVRRMEVVDNILDMRFFKTLLPALAQVEEPYFIFYEVKPNMRREQLEQLVAAGVRWMQPGIENLHDRVLELLDKGNTGAKNVEVLKWSRKLGIRLAWGFLFGAPQEKDEWYREMSEWIPWLYHLQPPTGSARIRYDRFSPYHYAPERFGVHLTPLRSYGYVYPLSAEELTDFAYFFEDYSDLSRGPIDPVTPGNHRPGLDAVRAQLNEWSQLFWGTQQARPVLTMVDHGERFSITDTRPVATERQFDLEGVDYWLYKLCEVARPREALESDLRERLGGGLTTERTQAAIDGLVGRRVLLPIGGKYLALAVEEPLAAYPDESMSPEGYLSVSEVFRGYAKKSFINAASRDPMAVPVGHLFLRRTG
jgi:magnesium-protoporphyrin IX monomethyl ester (oxidative) cyclase